MNFESIGDFLTGIAAVTSVGIAFWTIFKEIPKWKRQQRDLKKAEIAGRALASAIRFEQFIRYVGSPFHYADKNSQKEGANAWQKECFNRLTESKTDLEDFVKAMNEAEVFLSDEINMQLNELWKVWVDTKVYIELSSMMGSHRPPVEVLDQYANLYGEEGRKRREGVMSDLKVSLRPVARMDE